MPHPPVQFTPRVHGLVVKDTHRALWYENGVLTEVRGAGKCTLPLLWRLFPSRHPRVEVVLVDVRQREFTIKAQEILTADKVAVRVSILVQYRVADPKAAIHAVENYEDRQYSDVQLAARRSLATMTLDEILTNRNRLNEDILADVKEAAARYGVEILRADVKDLTFPGNLQEIMNKVLGAERLRESAIVEARTRAETHRVEAESKAEARRLEAEAQANAVRTAAAAEAEARRLSAEAERIALNEAAQSAAIYRENPSLLRLKELETLAKLGHNSNARIYIGFKKHADEE